MKGHALRPEAKGLPVDGSDDAHRHERVCNENAGKGSRTDRRSLEDHRRIEYARAALVIFHVYREFFSGRRQPPRITLLHRHERRYVQRLRHARVHA